MEEMQLFAQQLQVGFLPLRKEVMAVQIGRENPDRAFGRFFFHLLLLLCVQSAYEGRREETFWEVRTHSRTLLLDISANQRTNETSSSFVLRTSTMKKKKENVSFFQTKKFIVSLSRTECTILVTLIITLQAA